MKLLSALVATLLITPACFSQERVYTIKGKSIPIPNNIFDPTMDCGLNLEAVEKCIRTDRENERGESFCNDIKLFAGNKQKLIDANDATKKNPSANKTQLVIIEGLNAVQKTYSERFMKAGLTKDQLEKIPPLKRGDPDSFKCRKKEDNTPGKKPSMKRRVSQFFRSFRGE